MRYFMILMFLFFTACLDVFFATPVDLSDSAKRWIEYYSLDINSTGNNSHFKVGTDGILYFVNANGTQLYLIDINNGTISNHPPVSIDSAICTTLEINPEGGIYLPFSASGVLQIWQYSKNAPGNVVDSGYSVEGSNPLYSTINQDGTLFLANRLAGGNIGIYSRSSSGLWATANFNPISDPGGIFPTFSGHPALAFFNSGSSSQMNLTHTNGNSINLAGMINPTNLFIEGASFAADPSQDAVFIALRLNTDQIAVRKIDLASGSIESIGSTFLTNSVISNIVDLQLLLDKSQNTLYLALNIAGGDAKVVVLHHDNRTGGAWQPTGNTHIARETSIMQVHIALDPTDNSLWAAYINGNAILKVFRYE